ASAKSAASCSAGFTLTGGVVETQLPKRSGSVFLVCFGQKNTARPQARALRQTKEVCGVASLPIIGHQQATFGCGIVQQKQPRWKRAVPDPSWQGGSRSCYSCSASSWKCPETALPPPFAAVPAALKASRRRDCSGRKSP